jgi:putative transposon-encoded protein
MKVEVRAYQVIEKVVKASGSSGRVYVPPDWVGKRVKILLMESLE